MYYMIEVEGRNGTTQYLAKGSKEAYSDGFSPWKRIADRFEDLASARKVAAGLPAAKIVHAASGKPLDHRYSIEDVKRANKEAGKFFFEPDSMRFFSSRVCADVFTGPGGVYFVTSERREGSSRLYSVRIFDPATGEVDTFGAFQGFPTRSQAINAARKASEGKG